MARPREFDEDAVLDAAVACFWRHGFDATSIRDLVGQTGLTAASLYNAFGDKRSLFRLALERYIAGGIGPRLARYEAAPPLDGVRGYLDDVVARSLDDPASKGCMVVNAALEFAAQDAEFRPLIIGTFARIEAFFLDCVRRGQGDGSITRAMAAEDLALHCLAVLMGVRVLARIRPERAVLNGAVAALLAALAARPEERLDGAADRSERGMT
ncbi:TetR/AcrR family transcriptional regulator [Gluconacetobacter asukensis]|uniref:TetR/AcrR family transcriptional regulator n=1 Tax=Gluconacetobacter asukensis TaxID=1017181 RepID=A0A7W4J008_9PROT|nr:TetR/AcrR family transcriptional regulator [Gluconacetobacter asukensis]MBB2172144.1 TetR/AcrR family transcriptional regulator [Gluconacetobacter asukensis]